MGPVVVSETVTTLVVLKLSMGPVALAVEVEVVP